MSTVVVESESRAEAIPPDGEALYEVVGGKRVELPPMSTYASLIASRLGARLDAFAEPRRLGRTATETLFLLNPEEDLRRRPDIAYVSAERWPLDRLPPLVGDWALVPDLAVEVISPNDLFQPVLAKMREYFDYGVRLVWIVVPAERQVYVYTSPTQNRILALPGELDGGDVLPGFRITLHDLFLLLAPVPQASA